MKKLLTLLITLAFTGAMAQTSVGVRGSFTASTMTKFDLIDNVTPDFKFLPSAGGAFFAEFALTEQLSLQTELGYVRKGFSVREGIDVGGDFLGINIPVNAKVDFRTNYIELPVLAKLHLGDKNAAHSYIAIGPSLGYMVDASIGTKVFGIFPINTNLNNNLFKDLELSGVVAAGFEVPLSEKMMVFTEARYTHGFSRSLNTPIIELPVRSRTLAAGLGLKYNL